MLWALEKNETKQVKFGRVPSEVNAADMYTKFLRSDATKRDMSTISCEYAEWEGDIALTVNVREAEATGDHREGDEVKWWEMQVSAVSWKVHRKD